MNAPAKNIGRQAGVVFAANWGNSILRLAIGIFIVRHIGASGKGTVYLVQASASVLAVLLSFGLHNSLVYHLRKSLIRQSHAIASLVASAAFTFFATILIVRNVNPTGWKILLGGHQFSSDWCFAIAFYVPALYASLFLKAHFLAKREVAKYAAVLVTPSIAVITYILAASATRGLTVLDIVNATVSIEVLVAIAFILVVYFEADATEKRTVAHGAERAILAYGLKGHIGTVGTNLASHADGFILAAFTSTTEVGYYSVAKFAFQVVRSIPLSLNGLLMGVYCETSPRNAYRINKRVVAAVSLALLLIGIVGFFAAGPTLEYVYGREFTAARVPLQILLLSAVIGGASSPYTTLLLSQGKPGAVSQIGVCTGISRVTLSAILISQWSIVGAAIASAITAIGTTALRIFLAKKHGPRNGPSATDSTMPDSQAEAVA